MVLAEDGAARGDIVLGLNQIPAQRQGLVVGRAHAAQCEVHAVKRRLAIDEGEGLRNHQLVRRAQEAVELAGRGMRRIFPDREHRAELARRARVAGELKGVPAETDAAVDDGAAEVPLYVRDRTKLPVEEEGEKLERLGECFTIRLVKPEQTGAVGG